MKIINLVLVALALLVAFSTYAGDTMLKTITIHTLTGEEANYDESKRRVGFMVIRRQTLYTIEKPWLPNPEAPDKVGGGIPYKSAVPLGDYVLVLRDSPKKGMQWHFYNPDLNVFLEEADMQHDWQRFSTMFHIANYVKNVVGCVGPGTRLYDFGGTKGFGVSSSATALGILKSYLEGEHEAKLRII